MSRHSLSAIGLFLVIAATAACASGGDTAPATTVTPQTSEAPATTTAQTTVVPTTTAALTTTTTMAPKPLKIDWGYLLGCEQRWSVYVYGLDTQPLERPITIDLWIDGARTEHTAQFIEDLTLDGNPSMVSLFEDEGYEAVGYFELRPGGNVDINLEPGRYGIRFQVVSGNVKANIRGYSIDVDDCG